MAYVPISPATDDLQSEFPGYPRAFVVPTFTNVRTFVPNQIGTDFQPPAEASGTVSYPIG